MSAYKGRFTNEQSDKSAEMIMSKQMALIVFLGITWIELGLLSSFIYIMCLFFDLPYEPWFA